eukprot:gene26325-17420_t
MACPAPPLARLSTAQLATALMVLLAAHSSEARVAHTDALASHNTETITRHLTAYPTRHLAVDAATCSTLEQKYHAEMGKDPVPPNEASMTYFLHVPRTAGRTFQSCLMRPAYEPRARCPPSYDSLKFNLSKATCSYLSTHDDYSIIPQIPGGVSVFTHIRDPVDRILSAYEFAVVNAAAMSVGRIRKGSTRRIGPIAGRNLKSSLQGRIRANKGVSDNTTGGNPRKSMTSNVWPWSYLIPFHAASMTKSKAS